MILTSYKTYYVNRNSSTNVCKLMLQEVVFQNQSGKTITDRLKKPSMVIENFGQYDTTDSSVTTTYDRSGTAWFLESSYSVEVAALKCISDGVYGLDIGDTVPALVVKFWDGSWQYEIYYLGGSNLERTTQMDKFQIISSFDYQLLARDQGITVDYEYDTVFDVLFTDEIGAMSIFKITFSKDHGELLTSEVSFKMFRSTVQPTYADGIVFVDFSGITNVCYGIVRNSTEENIIFGNLPKVNYLLTNSIDETNDKIDQLDFATNHRIDQTNDDVESLEGKVNRLTGEMESAYISR